MESLSSGQQPMEILAVELYDNSSFKFPLTSTTTPKQILANVAKKASLTLMDFFGLCAVKLPESMASPSTNRGSFVGGNVAISLEEEWFFLLDEVPIVDQLPKQTRSKLKLALKYSIDNPMRDLDDPKVIMLIFKELSDKLKLLTSDLLKKEELISLIALQCHIKKEVSPSVALSHIQDVKEFAPKLFLTSLNDDFYSETLNATKGLAGVSSKDAMKRFLFLAKNFYPSWFESRYDALHVEFVKPTQFKLQSDGLYISLFDKVSSHAMILTKSTLTAPFYIPFKNLMGWSMCNLDDEDPNNNNAVSGGIPLVGLVDQRKDSKPKEKQSKEDFLKNILTVGVPPVAQLKSTDIPPRARPQMTKKLVARLDPESLPFSKDKKYKYSLTLYITDEFVSSIDLVLFSSFQGDYRLVEQLAFLAAKSKQKEDLGAAVSLNDDPDKSGNYILIANVIVDAPIYCRAKQDCTAKGEGDLMFLAGEDILVTKKLGPNIYLGECQGIEGKFSGDYVNFSRPGRDSKLVELLGSSAKGISGEVINVSMLDDTRRSLVLQPTTTAKQLCKMMCEKLEITDQEFFSIYEETSEGDRELIPSLPVLHQGINQTTKITFKLRMLYHDVAELTDSNMVYFYYIQVKKNILQGVYQMSETEVVDLASVQLQATHGDYDPDKLKGVYMGSLALYLPISYQKMSLTKNETWWIKKFTTAHQQHRGLTKTESEKAYIAMAQRLNLYGYQFYSPLVPDNIIFGISRDYLAIIDKSTQALLEKAETDFKRVSFRSQSLVTVVTYANSDGAEKTQRLLTTQTANILSILELLRILDYRNQLRRRCKGIREKIPFLGIITQQNIPPEYSGAPDPDLLLVQLRNGVLLNAMSSAYEAFSENPDKPPEPVQFEVFEKQEPAYFAESLAKFQAVCAEKLNLSVTPISESSFDIANGLAGVDQVLTLLEAFLSHQAVETKINTAKEYNRARKSKPTKPNAATMAGGPGAPSPSQTMSGDDFMMRVMDELYQTESNYAKDLEKVDTQYVKPLKDKMEGLFTADLSLYQEVLAMFGNINDIAQFSKELVQELEISCKDITKVGSIGNAFTRNSNKFIELYTVYCANHSEPTDRLPDLKQSPELMAILGMNGDPSTDQMSKHQLSSQLIKPVQRIMRYHLLLKELVRYTPETMEGYKELENGLNAMKDVATHINEVKRKKENERILHSLVNKLEGFDGVLQLGDLLMSGSVQIIEKQALQSKSKFGTIMKDSFFYCFLFEEVMLFCKENKKAKPGAPGAYKYKYSGYTRDLAAKDGGSDILGDEFKNSWEFTRSDSQKSYIACCFTPEEKERWVATINDCSAKSNAKAPSERLDIESLKKRQSDTSILSTDSKKMFSSVKKLSSWKKDTAVSELEAEVANSPVSPPSLVTSPGAKSDAPSQDLDTQQLVAADATYDAICKQIDDVQLVVRQLIDETSKMSKDLSDSREREKQLEIELAVEKSRKQATISLDSTDVSKEQITGELEAEKRLRSDLLNSVNMLAQILRQQ